METNQNLQNYRNHIERASSDFTHGKPAPEDIVRIFGNTIADAVHAEHYDEAKTLAADLALELYEWGELYA